MRARRPVLPALTAVLAGALVAGAATLLHSPAAESSADQNQLSVDLTGQRPTDAGGSLEQPSTSAGSSSAAPTSSSSAAPPTTSSAPPPPPPPPTTQPPAPTTEPPPPAPPDASAQDRVVTLTNAARQDAGCGPLKIDARLTTAAQAHASDMAGSDYFSHTSEDGRTFDQRIRNAGYPSPGAENIAKGAQTADDVVDLWMNSPGHRANILNCDLATIGVGLDRNGFYWVQDFGF